MNTNPPIPLYYSLVEHIVRMIEEEEVEPGSIIMSEREMMEKFNLSRTTVRKAVDVLVNDGYLYRVQGKGTFVQNKKLEQGLIKLTSCTEDLKNKGLNPSTELLCKEVVVPKKGVSSHLALGENEKVLMMERIVFGDGIPINVTKSHFVYKYVPGIEKHDFKKESLYKIVEDLYGIKITHAVRTIEAVLANTKDAELLRINPGSPILLFNGVVYGIINGKEVPVEYFKSRYRCDKSKFYIEQIR